MNIKPIHTKKDLTIALSRIDELIDAKHGTQEYDELEILSFLVEVFEEKHSPIPSPDPIEAIKFRMDQADSQIPTVVQPDLVVICDQTKLDEQGCRGAPDLVIEITSPESISRDLKTKLNLYEKHGVKEYWVVNPGEKTISVFYRNKQGHYDKPAIYTGRANMRSEILGGISIVVSDVFG